MYVGSAPIKQIAKYGRIARGVDVEQSPTVVVADSRAARRDARRLRRLRRRSTRPSSTRSATRPALFTDPYLRKVNAVCRDYRSDFDAIAASRPDERPSSSAP